MADRYDAITEFRLNKRAKDIELFIYSLPVSDLDEKHKENSKVVSSLRKSNHNDMIVFNENLIGAFSKIDNWRGTKVNTSGEGAQRAIDATNARERALLERLIKRDIICRADKTLYKNVNGKSLKSIKPVISPKDADVYETTDIDVNIDESGYIVIGIYVSHEFVGKVPLDMEIANGNIEAGDKVKDIFRDCYYKYISVADFTISEPNKYMEQASIVEYYANKGESYITAKLPPDTKAVLVKTNKGEIFPYIPSRLRKMVRSEDLHGEANSVIKISADKKMRKTIDAAVSLTWTSGIARMDENKELHEKWIKNVMLCKNTGYHAYDLKKPMLRFGGGHACNYSYGNLINGINNFGPYKNTEGAVEIRYFVDSLILRDENKYKNVQDVIKDLEQRSAKSGVTLKRVPITDKAYEGVNMDDDTSFEFFLRGEADKGVFDSPTVFIMADRHLKKHYAAIKKVLSGRGGITTQCVNFDNLMKAKGKGKDSYMMNILLGIYAKSGIQAWALDKGLNSDCFIGLDVSRENGVNKGAVVQVIGKDGGVISSRVFAASQKGEAITYGTLREILIDAVQAFYARYGSKPHHITFHRDGRCFEDLDALAKIAKELGIVFDYVEITKDTNRRMAECYKIITNTADGEQQESWQWRTVMGRCYKKDAYAYLCATNPSQAIGMARTIRVTAKTHNLSMDKMIEDVWDLSFMHVHSLAKTRLPVTTHYADKCSIFGIRDWLSSNNGSLLFFV